MRAPERKSAAAGLKAAFLTLVLLTTHFTLAADTSDLPTFQRLESEMMNAFATGDRATLERMIAEEYILTSATSTGGRINKKNYIEGGLALIKVQSFRFHNMEVHRFGDTAIVYCQLDWKSTWGGKNGVPTSL